MTDAKRLQDQMQAHEDRDYYAAGKSVDLPNDPDLHKRHVRVPARWMPVEPLEALLREPHWTYIDGVLTPVLLPDDLRTVIASHAVETAPEAPVPTPEPDASPGGAGSVVEQAARTLYERYCAENGIVYEWRSYESSWWDVWVEQAQALADAGLLADPLGPWRHVQVEAARQERDEARARVAELEAAEMFHYYVDAIARLTPCTCSAQRQRAEKAEGERDRARDLAAALEADNARLTEELDAWRSGRRRRAWPSHPAVPDAIGTAAMLARAQTGEDERLDPILREGAATITALRDGYGVAAAERDEARARVADLEAENARLTEERDERQENADWAWRCANGYGERAEAAEARARRAEDALSAVKLAVESLPDRSRLPIPVAAAFLVVAQALSATGRTSDVTPSDTTTEEDA